MGDAVAERELRLTGRTAPPPATRRLRAGAFELELDGIDLRRVRWRDVEIAEQVFVAVRPPTWDTVPGTVADLEVSEAAGPSFLVRFRCRHEHEGALLEWLGEIEGSAEGRLRYALRATAITGVTYARIGLNVLHGAATYRGRRYRASGAGPTSDGTLPDLVGPQAVRDGRMLGLFPPFRRLELWPGDDLLVRIDLDGDDFETEDQRNYGDPNFKTYSTPLQRPGPFRLEPGATLEQSVRIEVEDARPAERHAAPRSSVESVAALTGPTGRSLPDIGLACPHDGAPLSPSERQRVLAIRPAHLRLELSVTDDEGELNRRLASARSDAAALGARLWVEARCGPDDEAALVRLMERVATDAPDVDLVLLEVASIEPLDAGRPRDLLLAARRATVDLGPSMRVGVAVPFLAGLTRSPFDPGFVEVASFGVSPTVHRADDATVMENAAAVEDMARTARDRMGERPVLVAPVTLATRHGPYPGGPAEDAGLPRGVDPRQPSLLAAAWTVGSLAGAIRGGADALTLYETVGWRGVLERDGGSPMPQRFPSEAGTVFPVWHVLADVGERQGAEVLDLRVEDARVAGLAVRDAAGTTLLLASLVREPIEVRLEGLSAHEARVRVLDAASATRATRQPERFREAWRPARVDAGALRVALDAYAVARIDLADGRAG
jgi:D-apionolactonase